MPSKITESITASKMRFTLFVFLFIQTITLFAQSSAVFDSLTTLINQSKGEEKLNICYQECSRAAAHTTVDNELALLHIYQAEAENQNNAKHEMMARTLRLYTFYNSNMHDSIFVYINNDLEVFQKHEQWDFYYSCRSLTVESYRYANRLQSALREAQAMYDFAVSHHSNYGKGVAAYLIASCHQSMNRSAQAVEFFETAEECMLTEGNVGQLHNMYGIAWESFLAAGENEKLQKMLDRWDDMWKEYCKKNEMQLTDVAIYYLVCVSARAHLYTDNKDFEAARRELDEAARLAENQKEISKALWLKEEARYAEAMGGLDTALHYLDECHKVQTNHNNQIAAVATQEMRANLLMKLGRMDEAAQIYRKLLPQKDAMMQLDMAAQLDDFSSIYKVDTLREEKILLRLWLTVALIGFGAMALLTTGYFYYQKKLQAKNRTIVLQYQKQKNTEKTLEQILDSESSTTSSDKDMEMFMEIKKFLNNKEVLSNPSLDRNLLAAEFGTNYTYISRAIQVGAGVNVSAYINQVRIDYACELLKQDSENSIAEVLEKCGFQSRSYFYRIFKSQMNMSPTEFQKELKE